MMVFMIVYFKTMAMISL